VRRSTMGAREDHGVDRGHGSAGVAKRYNFAASTFVAIVDFLVYVETLAFELLFSLALFHARHVPACGEAA
ncbi:hypothetical protein, partial [Pseudomonas aeruginosa]|uniref:hypothetical protein n=1 Tax=Pseudomonas aeruginosa TaxID=287 RepID=UPI0031B70E93